MHVTRGTESMYSCMHMPKIYQDTFKGNRNIHNQFQLNLNSAKTICEYLILLLLQYKLTNQLPTLPMHILVYFTYCDSLISYQGKQLKLFPNVLGTVHLIFRVWGWGMELFSRLEIFFYNLERPGFFFSQHNGWTFYLQNAIQIHWIRKVQREFFFHPKSEPEYFFLNNCVREIHLKIT